MSTFHALLIHLQATQDATLPLTQGQLAHAAFLALIEAVRPELSAELHDRKGRKPFTLSPVWGLPRAQNGQHRLRAGQKVQLRLTLLDMALFQAFMQKLLSGPGQRIRLGGAEFVITEVRGTPEGSEWAGYSTADGLAQRASAEMTRLGMQFKSPMAINLGAQDPAKKRIVLIPSPRHIFGALRGAWNALAGADIPREYEEWVAEFVMVREVRSWQTGVFHYERKAHPGGYGDVTFEALDPDPVRVQTLNLLADFAFYGGVGSRTGMGMGVARRLDHDR